MDLAVQAARTGHEKYWSKLRPLDRGKYIFRIARALQEKAREFAIVETMDGGKPIKESRDVDIPLAAAHFFTTRAGPTSSSTRSRGATRARSAWPGR